MALRHKCYSIVNVKLIELCTNYSFTSKRAPNGQQYSGQQYRMLVHLLSLKAGFKLNRQNIQHSEGFVKCYMNRRTVQNGYLSIKSTQKQKKIKFVTAFLHSIFLFLPDISLIYHYVRCYQVSFHGLF